ncbi:MAG: acyl-protein synthetase, partial [Firmicutes bacterium]|nr:acyl-protein synthetase [Bacillota bacterium]
MDQRQKLFSWKEMYDTVGTEQLFTEAMRENCQFQYDHCPEYKQLLDGMGFHPSQLKTPEDLGKLPPLPTTYFKA